MEPHEKLAWAGIYVTPVAEDEDTLLHYITFLFFSLYARLSALWTCCGWRGVWTGRRRGGAAEQQHFSTLSLRHSLFRYRLSRRAAKNAVLYSSCGRPLLPCILCVTGERITGLAQRRAAELSPHLLPAALSSHISRRNGRFSSLSPFGRRFLHRASAMPKPPQPGREGRVKRACRPGRNKRAGVR